MKSVSILITLILLLGCSGTDTVSTDTTPPAKPTIYLHQGDTGDVVEGDTLNFYQLGDSVFNWEDENENNGIDAVAGPGDVLQIQWRPLVDTDLSDIYIHRFNTIDDDTLEVDNINPDKTSYEDLFTELVGSAIGKDWFYFIDVFDEAGNNTVSDTVCYHLLEKPILAGPYDGITVNSLADVTFEWAKTDSDEVPAYRLLVFNSNREILWIQDTTTDNVEETYYSIPYSGPPVSNGEIIWRVDSFLPSNTATINGRDYIIPRGSESEEWEIIVGG